MLKKLPLNCLESVITDGLPLATASSPNTAANVAPAPLHLTDAHTQSQQSQSHLELPPSVRFSSAVEEFAPEPDHYSSSVPAAEQQQQSSNGSLGNPGDITPDQIKDIARSLNRTACPMQERRMGMFSYEPYSLPVSRVSANDSSFPYWTSSCCNTVPTSTLSAVHSGILDLFVSIWWCCLYILLCQDGQSILTLWNLTTTSDCLERRF